MWIGWASAVKLAISQTSVAPRAVFSVIGSSQPGGTGSPLVSSVPRNAAEGPTSGRTSESASLSETWRVAVAGPSGFEGRHGELVGRHAGVVGRQRRHDEFHDLAGGRRVRTVRTPQPGDRRPAVARSWTARRRSANAGSRPPSRRSTSVSRSSVVRSRGHRFQREGHNCFPRGILPHWNHALFLRSAPTGKRVERMGIIVPTAAA
jgi:hypothetical protein